LGATCLFVLFIIIFYFLVILSQYISRFLTNYYFASPYIVYDATEWLLDSKTFPVTSQPLCRYTTGIYVFITYDVYYDFDFVAITINT